MANHMLMDILGGHSVGVLDVSENFWNIPNNFLVGARSSVVVKALCYKPEGRGFDSR
jgi:hypothetical protein